MRKSRNPFISGNPDKAIRENAMMLMDRLAGRTEEDESKINKIKNISIIVQDKEIDIFVRTEQDLNYVIETMNSTDYDEDGNLKSYKDCVIILDIDSKK